MAEESLEQLTRQVAGCRICVEQPRGEPLPHEPNPIVRISSTARLCIAGQAAGTLAHASSKPFNDPSGVRLRDWMRRSANGPLRFAWSAAYAGLRTAMTWGLRRAAPGCHGGPASCG